MKKVTNKQIRKYLGHNGCECIVRISRDGSVSRFGAVNVADRSKDYWTVLGNKNEIVRCMTEAA